MKIRTHKGGDEMLIFKTKSICFPEGNRDNMMRWIKVLMETYPGLSVKQIIKAQWN